MSAADHARSGRVENPPAIILVEPQLGENIGTAARAMANFALGELRIVNPRDGWPSERARRAAAGADKVIERAQVFENCAQAVGDLNYLYATTARRRDVVKPVITPADAGPDMRVRAARGQRLGILFGRERFGLRNDEVALADAIVMAPVEPSFASLNVAQAVLLMGYEWFKHDAVTIGQATPELPAYRGSHLPLAGSHPATKQELDGFFAHLEKELVDCGFLRPPEKAPAMMRNIRSMFLRAQLTEQEVRTLRGIVSGLTHAHERRAERDRSGR
jgi:tRNA/rRNA methyltransferase